MKNIFLVFLLLFSKLLYAEVDVASKCYGTSILRDKNSQPIYLLIKSYSDPELGLEVGALAKYKSSKTYIPLVFLRRISTDQDDLLLVNFELHRAEIGEGKITGEYVLIQSGAGIKQGKYLEYTNIRSSKKTIFFEEEDVTKCLDSK